MIALLAIATDALEIESYAGFNPEKRKSAINPGAFSHPGFSHGPERLLVSPGLEVGRTWYDLQSNGSTGNRIALDALGGVHFCWTGTSDPSLSNRYIDYGFLSEDGDSLLAVSLTDRAGSGFGGIGILRGAVDPAVANAAVIGYHNSPAMDVRFALDSTRGAGDFSIDSTGFPDGSTQLLWPSFSIDINDNTQAVAVRAEPGAGQPRAFVYTRRAYGSSSWSTPLVIDTIYTISPMVTSSRISAKSAIAWSSPILQDSNEYDNDVAYLESPDGINWNVGNRVNITGYPAGAQGDTVLRAYCDLDALYDFDDHLHIVWNASNVTRDSADGPVVLYRSALYHWSAATGIDLIYEHPTREWPADMGAWNLPVAKPSIGVDPDSDFLYVTFTRFDPSDYAAFDTINGDLNPCGGDNAMPCANGEIYLTLSTSGGNAWAAPVNLTGSPSPNCWGGNCDSDDWASLAEIAGDYLHIIYVNDKDAGAAALGEGDSTNSPVLYLRLQNPTRTPAGGCPYAIGDINDSGTANGIDVTYGVGYFKGGNPPPVQCDCPPHGNLYVAGDVNASCTFNGIDITYFVAYLKGGSPLRACADCPPDL